MIYFTHVYFDAIRIQLIRYRDFHGKKTDMTQERAVYRIHTDRPPLATSFENVFQRVAAAPGGEPERILAAFASSLLNSDAFNLAQIEQLTNEDDRHLCLALFEFCMSVGLTEDERREASDAFAPFVEINSPGTRH